MAENYWDYVNDFDHNNISYTLKTAGVDENKPLTLDIISSLFGNDRVDTDFLSPWTIAKAVGKVIPALVVRKSKASKRYLTSWSLLT